MSRPDILLQDEAAERGAGRAPILLNMDPDTEGRYGDESSVARFLCVM